MEGSSRPVCRPPRSLPYTFGKLRLLEDVMFLSNPFKFPTIEDVQKGIQHVLWLCRKEVRCGRYTFVHTKTCSLATLGRDYW